MPSAKILSEKQAYVADLKAKFESAVSGCVVAYGGIKLNLWLVYLLLYMVSSALLL